MSYHKCEGCGAMIGMFTYCNDCIQKQIKEMELKRCKEFLRIQEELRQRKREFQQSNRHGGEIRFCPLCKGKKEVFGVLYCDCELCDGRGLYRGKSRMVTSKKCRYLCRDVDVSKIYFERIKVRCEECNATGLVIL